MELLDEYEVSNLLDVSLDRLNSWANNGRLAPVKFNGIKLYDKKSLNQFPIAYEVFNTKWDDFIKIKPKRSYSSIELFAGAGGMALGMEKAGFKHVLLNEFEKNSCKTLKFNRPNWNVLEADIRNVNFTEFKDKVDIVTGGFPCQAFSSAGKKLGFEDTRGTLFFDFARCITEVNPKVET